MSQVYNLCRQEQEAIETLVHEVRRALLAGRVLMLSAHKQVTDIRRSAPGGFSDFAIVYYALDGRVYREDGSRYFDGVRPFTSAYEALLGKATSE